MQATVVMLIALGGLGCQNPGGDLPPLPPITAGPAETSADTPAYASAPAAYPVYASNPVILGDIPEDDSLGGCLRETFCSFFIGRSPDVPSARDRGGLSRRRLRPLTRRFSAVRILAPEQQVVAVDGEAGRGQLIQPLGTAGHVEDPTAAAAVEMMMVPRGRVAALATGRLPGDGYCHDGTLLEECGQGPVDSRYAQTGCVDAGKASYDSVKPGGRADVTPW